MADESEPTSPSAAVVLLCGLPASGKSTFARALMDVHRRRCHEHTNGNGVCNRGVDDGQRSDTTPVNSGFDKIVLVDYDSIAENELALCSDTTDAGESSQHASFESNDLEAWRRSRVLALNELKDTLISHVRTDNNKSSLLVVMDDNFHLRSMRRDVYRSCQEVLDQYPAQIGYSSIYFSTPLEICIQRNDERSGKERIPTDVMQRMAANMEPPDGSKPYASFERFHVSIDNSDGSTIDDNALHEIDQCIQKSLQSPIPPKKVLTEDEMAQQEEERMRQREETLKCQLQRADQLLRKMVGAVGRVDKTRSKEANETRKSIMEMLRKQDGTSTFDMDDDSIARHFACAILGVGVTDDWRNPDDAIVSSIQDALQQFQLDRKGAIR